MNRKKKIKVNTAFLVEWHFYDIIWGDHDISGITYLKLKPMKIRFVNCIVKGTKSYAKFTFEPKWHPFY